VEIQAELIEQALAAHRAMMRAVHLAGADVWQDLDLTMAQLKTLLTLADVRPATIGQVADALGVGLPNASHLVDRLVHAGLVERAEDPADRRRTLARLAPAGEELVVRLRQGSRDQFRSWLALMDEADLAAFVTGLQALARVAEREASARLAESQRACASAVEADHGRRAAPPTAR